MLLEYCFLYIACLGIPGDMSGETAVIGEVRPNFSPNLSGRGDSFDGLYVYIRELKSHLYVRA